MVKPLARSLLGSLGIMISRTLTISLLGFLLACGSSTTTTNDNGGNGGNGGQGGDGGAGGMGGNVPDPDESDHEALAACNPAPACAEAFAQRIEGGESLVVRDFACVLTAMRDRTPGTYLARFDDTFSNGSAEWPTTFVITPSGAVEMAVIEDVFVSSDVDIDETDFLPTVRCQLKDASFFESCLAVYADETSDADAWACIFPSPEERAPWFASCTEAAPTCQ